MTGATWTGRTGRTGRAGTRAGTRREDGPVRRTTRRRVAASAVPLVLAFMAPAGGCADDSSSRPGSSMITRIDATDPPPAKPVPTTGDTPADQDADRPVAPTGPGGEPPLVRIMPLGDSLTQGNPPAQTDRGQSYRGFLFQSLTAAGYRVDLVGSDTTPTAKDADPDNEGHGGYTIGPDGSRFCAACPPANVSDNVEQWLADNPADVVLLMLGINDLLPRPVPDPSGMVRPVDPAQAGAKLQALVARIRTAHPTTTVLVASQPPMPFLWNDPALLAAYDGLNRAAETAGDVGVVHVPMNRELLPWWVPGLHNQLDELHPTAAGAELIAEVWFEALVPVLGQRTTGTG